MSFSVIASLKTASGSPTSMQQAQFEGTVRKMWEDTTVLSKYGIANSNPTAKGSTGCIFTLRSRAATSSATKAKGASFVEGTASSYNITTTYEAPEGLEQNYDWTEEADARYNTMAIDAANQVLVETEQREQRLVAALYKAATASAISGYTQSPGAAIHGSGSTYSAITGYYSQDNTGAERVYADLVDLKTDMTNSPRRKGNNWGVVIRHDCMNALLYGTRVTSKDFNSGADMQFGVRPQLLGLPLLTLNDSLWISSTANTVAYTDKSFSKYNVDARFAGATGVPCMFLINWGNDVSPLAETIPPGMAGITVRAFSDERREVDTALVKARYAYDTLYPDAVGMAALR